MTQQQIITYFETSIANFAINLTSTETLLKTYYAIILNCFCTKIKKITQIVFFDAKTMTLTRK